MHAYILFAGVGQNLGSRTMLAVGTSTQPEKVGNATVWIFMALEMLKLVSKFFIAKSF